MPPSLDAPGTCFFEDRLTGEGDAKENIKGSARVFTSPRAIIEARQSGEVEDALAELARLQADGKFLAGYISYEAGYSLEPRFAALAARPEATQPLPLLRFYVYDSETRLCGREADELVLSSLIKGHRISVPAPCWSYDDYAPRMERALELIRAGDIYQANLTFPLEGHIEGAPLSLYAALRTAQPVGFGAYLALDEARVLSLSPELFVRRDGARLETRPMKGTAPRGQSAAQDELNRRALRADPKERAENLMIVDLLRNDLSRVCRPGTVKVRDLFKAETYPTLHTMTSTVEGTLAPGATSATVLRALFPCGSVTGAPKIRAQEVIRDLEEGARGIYTGAIGYLTPDGGFCFNVAIRTLTVFADGTYTYPVGGGIVADSVPAREYGECLLKGQVIAEEAAPFDLIETIAWSREEGFTLLPRHLERLEASAAFFGRPYDRKRVLAVLDEATADAREDRLRVRLLLSADGEMTIETKPLENELPLPLPFVFSGARVDAGDPYLRHKTTRRAVFEDALGRAATVGAREALFENQYGEITEGAWTNVFVERGGKLLTPPLSSGLLPGTLRAELLATGRAIESVLTRKDIRAADAVYLGNSVRGLMKAQALERGEPAQPAPRSIQSAE